MTLTSNKSTKLRAAFLSFLMVVSIVGSSIALSGAAAAQTSPNPEFDLSSIDGEKFIQGENINESITFFPDEGDTGNYSANKFTMRVTLNESPEGSNVDLSNESGFTINTISSNTFSGNGVDDQNLLTGNNTDATGVTINAVEQEQVGFVDITADNDVTPGNYTMGVTVFNRDTNTTVGDTSTATFEVTGSVSGLAIEASQTEATIGDSVTINASFVDNDGRVVPVNRDILLSTEGPGTFDGSTSTTVTTTEGSASATLNSSGSGSVDITASTGQEAPVTTEVTFDSPSTSVTFDNKTVVNGSETVTVDSANFTRADGSAGDYVVVVHTIDEFGAPVGNVSPPIGASGNLTGAEENITVDLTAAGGPINNITENVTLRAMLHTTSNDSAFDTRLGRAINGIEPGDETDDAVIGVSEDGAEVVGPDVNGNGEPAVDTDGDGQFEDVNGDNATNIGDVQALVSGIDTGTLSDGDSGFNFNNDPEGRVNIGDVQALVSQLLG